MTAPVWLIAGREFRTYVATASFWVALAVGPVIMGGALLLSASQPPPAPQASLTLARTPDGGAEARFSDGFPLSSAGRAQVLNVLRADGRITGRITGRIREAAPAPATPIDVQAISRFALVVLLWTTLTGSLGMLLQAVVRERVNRALESLLAAASAWDIVCGKLIGVGGVSALVVTAWLGSSAGLAALAPRAGGLAAFLLHGVAQPEMLARAGGIYLIAYAFFGLTTVAIGARAKDNADAQNLARPMFAVLLAVFFAAMASAGGGARNLAWLVYVPPFTPFMLLMQPQPLGTELAAIALLGAATALAGWLAARALTLDATTRPIFGGGVVRTVG